MNVPVVQQNSPQPPPKSDKVFSIDPIRGPSPSVTSPSNEPVLTPPTPAPTDQSQQEVQTPTNRSLSVIADEFETAVVDLEKLHKSGDAYYATWLKENEFQLRARAQRDLNEKTQRWRNPSLVFNRN